MSITTKLARHYNNCCEQVMPVPVIMKKLMYNKRPTPLYVVPPRASYPQPPLNQQPNPHYPTPNQQPNPPYQQPNPPYPTPNQQPNPPYQHQYPLSHPPSNPPPNPQSYHQPHQPHQPHHPPHQPHQPHHPPHQPHHQPHQPHQPHHQPHHQPYPSHQQPQHQSYQQPYQPYPSYQQPQLPQYNQLEHTESSVKEHNYPIVLYQSESKEVSLENRIEAPISDIHYHIPPSYPIIEYSDNIIILPGNIVTYVSDQIPDGYLLCDGSDASREVDSILFSVIGTFYGDGDGSTTFCLPDLEDENQSNHYMIKR